MSSREDAQVDVLVVNYHSALLTADAVASAQGPGCRVLVWDNSGDCPEVVGAEVYGDGTNHFFAEANNRLFRMGSADYVLVLNPDVTLAVGAVDALVAELAGRPQSWGVTTRLTGTDGHDQNYLHALPTTRALLADRLPPLRGVFRREFRRYRCLDLPLGAQTTVEQPPAALLLLRRSQVEAVGGLFDPAYPLFFNDVDLARRLSLLGRCQYLAEPASTHVGGASLRAAGKRGEPVSALYQDAVVTYARRHLAGWPLVLAAVKIRSMLDRLRGGWWA